MVWALVIMGAAVLLAGAGVAVGLYSFSRRLTEFARAQETSPAALLLQGRIGQLEEKVDRQLQLVADRLQSTTGRIDERIADVKKDLGEVSQATRQVYDLARDISQLEEMLKAPKFRGGLGELFLGDLLNQILPPSGFSLQHRFKSGETVDAAIRIGSNLVPVDSKFPLDNFRRIQNASDDRDREVHRKSFIRDVKKHIDDIARKYILPDEGTFDFALMYIPAENIYYETIIRDETLGEEKGIFNHALRRRVIPVSPNSFYAYLQVIILGLKGLRIEAGAQEIYRMLSRLEGDLKRFKTDFELVGTHLTNARSKYESADKRLTGLSLKIASSNEAVRLPDSPMGEEGEARISERTGSASHDE